MTAPQILNKILRQDAKRLGASEDVFDQWYDNDSCEELAKRYKKHIDFCIRHNWPSMSFIRQHFTREELRNNGILLDDSIMLPLKGKNRRFAYLPSYVLLGNSKTTLKYAFSKHKCVVWACNQSKVKADVKYGAYIEIHLFDNATADINTDLVSKVLVVRHCQNTRVKKNGIVTVNESYCYLE